MLGYENRPSKMTFYDVKEFFSRILISKMGVNQSWHGVVNPDSQNGSKNYFTSIPSDANNHASDQEKGFLTKSMLSRSMPTA